jgi:hypothetical protein
VTPFPLQAGKNITEGSYVLPSGKRLPFGAMIAKLKRQRMLNDAMEVRRESAVSCLSLLLPVRVSAAA